MAEKKTKRKKYIFVQVFITYAVLLLFFAVVLGLVFIRLYTTKSTDYTGTEISNTAENIAERYREFIVDEDYDQCLEYVENFTGFSKYEIWAIANPSAANPMNSSIVTFDTSDMNLQNEFGEIIASAFRGKPKRMNFYSEIHGATAMAAGAPVFDANSKVCGCIVIISTLQSLDDTISSGRSMIVISLFFALIAAFAFALALARQITRPIARMREAARLMTEGNYRAKTGIESDNEIGDMAAAIDNLADKLLENDIERKNAEQMRLDFFANVSHELRTPIAVVRAYTESLVDGVTTDAAQVQQIYERMLRECKGMERLVADLLTLSKMQNPNFKIEKEPVNLIHILDEITRSAAALGEEKHLTIDYVHDSDVYMMLGDYDRLRQMFLVIMDNAVKFSKEYGTIHVIIRSGEKLTVSIRDEGVGITSEELPNIFDKFYKSKLRQNAKGTGLGLPIAKYICLKHDGDIAVKSEPERGTEFIFSFTEVSEEELERMFMQ